jgi:hypothetical protein
MPAPKSAREVEFEVLGKENSKPGPNDDPLIAFIARLMDNAFVIPGTNIRFGLDPIIGLIPALGATTTSLVSIALIALSARRGVPKVVLARMAANVLVNAAIDSVPVLGDIGSVFYRSNARNYDLLRKHAGPVRVSTTGDWIFLLSLLLGVIFVIGLMLVGTVVVLRALLAPSSG